MDKKELISLYFSKKLDSDNQKEFMHLMDTDKEFFNEVEFQKNLKEVIKIEEREKLKKQLQNLENKERSYKKWFVAASLIILLGVSGFWFLSSKKLNSQDLFTQHFEPYRNIVHPIVRGESSIDLKTKAFYAYEIKNYQEALILFDSINKTEDSSIINFYKANTLLQLGKTKKAIELFKNNNSLPDNLIEKKQWYLALAYIKIDDYENAKKILNQLSNTLSTYKKKEILELLKHLN